MIGPRITIWTAHEAQLVVSVELVPFNTTLQYKYGNKFWLNASGVLANDDLSRVLTYLVIKHPVLSKLCAHYEISQPPWFEIEVAKDLAEIEEALR